MTSRLDLGEMTYARIARDGLVLLGILACAFYWVYLTQTTGLPVDVRYYWAADPADLYPRAAEGLRNGYVYTPAFEFVVGWWRDVPFEVFVAIWRAILLATLVYLAGPFTIFVLFTVPVASEINAGNIQLLLALAVVLGFRYPGTWSFVLLTKVTPGVGLLWFAIRRQWRHLAVAFGVTAAIALVSLVLAPNAWRDYLGFISGNAAPSVAPYYLPLWVRMPFALGFIIWGGVTGHRWPVVVGATLALPVYYITSSAMLVGVFPYLREELGRRLREGRLIPRLGPAA